ncbi:hypothetical protein O181_097290 [Austropuccinia psidii MF-1]|uniref:Uncharacterized protein n=1 Tax=Austropuccinia psidii MF-1 TaxID=1389203 RepID=A0A9Q3J9B0_9BASI|nr:hypothetical protein [Austropuccinia psidii MF-1]
MPQIMANLQSSLFSEASRPPDFKTPSIQAPDCFDDTQPFKFRSFIQSRWLIFDKSQEKFSEDRNKVLYDTSFLIVRAAKGIEPYLPNITNQDPAYILKNWALFETQIFTLFGEPNEVRKAEAELDALKLKNVEMYHYKLLI